MRTLALLVVGDEILAGEIRDENGPALLEAARAAGVRVVRLVAVPDARAAIAAELLAARGVAEVVVVSGGIGPTHDDETRQAIADALGVPLVHDNAAAEAVRGFYGDKTTEAELEMAMLPEGAALVRGPETGTIGFHVGGIHAFPGVPFLFRDLLAALLATLSTAPLHVVEIVTPRREGEIAPLLRALQADAPDVSIGSYPVHHDGIWHVRVVLRGPEADRLAALATTLRASLPPA